MYALPVAVLLAAIFADREETPPPQTPPPSPDPDDFNGLSRAEMVAFGGATPQHPLGDVSSAAIAPQAVVGHNGYGAQPGSWEAAWYGVWYGADPTTAQIEAINSQVMKIVKRILGWAVATKGPKLISINNQRDALIKQGIPTNSPQVTALEQKAFSILQGAGLQPGSPEYQTLRTLGAQRDHLLLQRAGRA